MMSVLVSTFFALSFMFVACGQQQEGVYESIDGADPYAGTAGTGGSVVPYRSITSVEKFNVEYERLQKLAARTSYEACVNTIPTCMSSHGQANDQSRLKRFCRWSCQWSCQKPPSYRSCVDEAFFYQSCRSSYKSCLGVFATCKQEYDRCASAGGYRGNTCTQDLQACMSETGDGYGVGLAEVNVLDGGCHELAKRCDATCEMTGSCSVSDNPWVTTADNGYQVEIWEHVNSQSASSGF